MKNFKIKKEDIKLVTEIEGGCIASDKITVEGLKVGYMYREKPIDDFDTGWRFFAGIEDESYTNNPDNFEMYDINTICNYDDSIIPFLESKIGASYEKTDNTFKLVKD